MLHSLLQFRKPTFTFQPRKLPYLVAVVLKSRIGRVKAEGIVKALDGTPPLDIILYCQGAIFV